VKELLDSGVSPKGSENLGRKEIGIKAVPIEFAFLEKNVY
jgi:hypothetical protein